MMTSVLPEVVSPTVMPGASKAKSMNWRPFTGRLLIFLSSITWLTMVRVGSTASDVACTSTISVTEPTVREKSAAALAPICSVIFCDCFLNPECSAVTV